MTQDPRDDPKPKVPEPADETSLQAELSAVRTSLAAVQAHLEGERERTVSRRDRFERVMESLEVELERAKRTAEERRDALRMANARLASPLVRVASKGTRPLHAFARMARRVGLPATPSAPPGRARQAPVAPDAVEAASPRAYLPREQPTATPDSATIAIHIPPPSWEAAANWGDTHFARGLQRAFERHGWRATVHIAPEADAPSAATADVALHLFGLSAPPVRPGQRSILWIISHPDRVRARQTATYDLVFAASESFADELTRRLGRPVHVLHQATDPDRFFPDESGPRHELLFIGNSRNTRRPILDALAGTNHELAVYGGSWTPELLDPRHLRGAWVANEDLHRFYSSADIVLNDHWADMRDEGFVSNRVYDVLASGGFVVSDTVAGMDEQFDGAIATFATPAEVVEVVDRFLADPDERARRIARGRAAVLARHTFDHRAATLIEAVRAAGRVG